MYTEHFQLSQRPFSRVPAANRSVMFPAFKSGFQRACDGIQDSGGPVLIISASGCGKSTMLALLEQRFKNQLVIATLNCAAIKDRFELIQCLLFELGLPFSSDNVGELRLTLIDHLKSPQRCPNGLLLLVDEAHNLSFEVLEELRMITNLVCGGAHKIKLVLAGCQALEEKLSDPRLESFNQRVEIRSYLQAMTRNESMFYVLAQLQMCGRDGREIFQPTSLEKLHDITNGVTRLMAQLCDHAMKMAASANLQMIDGPFIQKAWNDLQQLPDTSTPLVAETGMTGAGIIEFGSLEEDTPGAPSLNTVGSTPLTVSIEESLQEPGQQESVSHQEEEETDWQPPGLSSELPFQTNESTEEPNSGIGGLTFDNIDEIPSASMPADILPLPQTASRYETLPTTSDPDSLHESALRGHLKTDSEQEPVNSELPPESPSESRHDDSIEDPLSSFEPISSDNDPLSNPSRPFEPTSDPIQNHESIDPLADNHPHHTPIETNAPAVEETLNNLMRQIDEIEHEDDHNQQVASLASSMDQVESTPEPMTTEDVFGGSFDDEEQVVDIQTSAVVEQNITSSSMTQQEVVNLRPVQEPARFQDIAIPEITTSEPEPPVQQEAILPTRSPDAEPIVSESTSHLTQPTVTPKPQEFSLAEQVRQLKTPTPQQTPQAIQEPIAAQPVPEPKPVQPVAQSQPDVLKAQPVPQPEPPRNDDGDMLIIEHRTVEASQPEPVEEEPTEPQQPQGQVIRMNYQDLFQQLRNQQPGSEV